MRAIKGIHAERLEARVSREQKDLFERAAAVRGCSLTTFLVDSAREVAVRTIRENEIITLSGRDRDVFVAALLNPPKPSLRLQAAAKRFKKDADQ